MIARSHKETELRHREPNKQSALPSCRSLPRKRKAKLKLGLATMQRLGPGTVSRARPDRRFHLATVGAAWTSLRRLAWSMHMDYAMLPHELQFCPEERPARRRRRLDKHGATTPNSASGRSSHAVVIHDAAGYGRSLHAVAGCVLYDVAGSR
jgi:hypothetical protein